MCINSVLRFSPFWALWHHFVDLKIAKNHIWICKNGKKLQWWGCNTSIWNPKNPKSIRNERYDAPGHFVYTYASNKGHMLVLQPKTPEKCQNLDFGKCHMAGGSHKSADWTVGGLSGAKLTQISQKWPWALFGTGFSGFWRFWNFSSFRHHLTVSRL